MRWAYAVLLILSPAILYGLALLVTAFISTYSRRPCSACCRRGLRCVSFIAAMVVINGRRAPDSWAYYACERCGAGFKLHRGAWRRVEAEELQRYSGV